MALLWARGGLGQVELAELMVVVGHGPLTLKDLIGDGVLVVGGGGEDLRLFVGMTVLLEISLVSIPMVRELSSSSTISP